MKRQTDGKKEQVLTFLLIGAHFILSAALFYFFWILFRYHGFTITDWVGFRYNYIVLLGYMAALLFFNRTYNAYLLGYYRVRNLVLAQFLSQLVSIVLLYTLVSVAWRKLNSPLPFLGLLAAQGAWDNVWSLIANHAFFSMHPPRRTILIYRRELDRRRFGSIHGKPLERLYRVEKELLYDGQDYLQIRSQLQGFDAVFVAGVHPSCRNGIAKYCKEEGIPGFFLPHLGDLIMKETVHVQSFDSPVLFLPEQMQRFEYRVIKRAFDIAASGLALLLLSPVLLMTALAIRVCDGHPAIYRQKRLTKDGKEFQMYKFRSMRMDAEKDGIARLSTGDSDERVTPVGRIIRKVRLDELPQLWNIFKGDMSFVGPRPERPEIAEQIYETLPEFRLRLQVKAGLTGYAQVYGRYNTVPYEKLEFDLLYIANRGLVTDLMLLFATITTLFLPESTEGIPKGQTTAMDTEQAQEADSHQP